MKFVILPLLLALLLALSSCMGSASAIYLNERVVGELTEEDAEWAEMSEMLSALSVNSANLEEFHDTKTSIALHRESVLNYIYGQRYMKYAGDTDRLERINEANPAISAIAVIPAADFEYEMYRFFGGSVKITHESTELFVYLDEEKVYVPIFTPINNSAEMTLESVRETENTYRISFTATAEGGSYSYEATLIKREDGTFYFDRLEQK